MLCLLANPFILAAVKSGWPVLVLVVTLTVYLVEQFLHLHVLPNQSERQFPVLAWQLLLVVGLIAGYHCAGLMRWLSSVRGWVR